MNDTEADARRLLAVATEDMPPGIDLLGGFSAARRRDKVRRTRRRAVVSAGIAAAAASVTAVTLTAGSAPPALATVTTALTRTLSQSYHLTVQDSIRVTGPDAYSNGFTCTSEVDPVRHLEASSCSNGLRDRQVGGFAYVYFADAAAAGHPGRHWEQHPATSNDYLPSYMPQSGSFSAVTPQQMLTAIKQTGNLTADGTASGPGWTGTRYAFSATSMAAALNNRLSHHPLPGDKVTGTVDVDQQGQARALVVTSRIPVLNGVLVVTQSLTFSDFGAPVTVTAPPADQTFTGPPYGGP